MATANPPHEGWTPPAALAGALDTPAGHVGLEALLHMVWQAEADWRFNDKLDAATKTRRQERR